MKHNRKIAAILAYLIAGSIAGSTLLTGCGSQDTTSEPKQKTSSAVEVSSGVTLTTTE